MPVFTRDGCHPDAFLRLAASASRLPTYLRHRRALGARKALEMPMKSILFAAAATMALAAPAAAQSAPSWTGFYVGGRVGYVASPLKTNQSVLFDKNLDGSFDDTVTTAAGANAF